MNQNKQLLIAVFLSIAFLNFKTRESEKFSCKSDITKTVSKEMGKLGSKIASPFTKAISAVTKALMSVFKKAMKPVKSIWNELKTYIFAGGVFMGLVFLSPFLLFIVILAGILSMFGVPLWAGALIGTGIIGVVLYTIISWITGIKNKITKAINKVLDKIGLGKIWKKIKSVFGKVNPFSLMSKAFGVMISGLFAGICVVIDGIKKVIDGVKNGINGAINTINKIPGVNVRKI